MGCSDSKVHISSVASSDDTVEAVDKVSALPLVARTSSSSNLRISSEKARQYYVDEGTLDTTCNATDVELRAMLDDANALSILGKYFLEKDVLFLCKCWKIIQDFRKLSVLEDRSLKATQIISEFITCEGGLVSRNVVTELEVAKLQEKYDSYKSTNIIIPEIFFDIIQMKCFQILSKSFTDFINDDNPRYVDLCNTMLRKFNNVSASDFEYMECIGKGGFGMVVKGRKISSDKYYAIKIQSKTELFEVHREAPECVEHEKLAMAACKHPFIAELHYAFQTKSLVMLAMTLYVTDLSKILAVDHRIEYPSVYLYAAEITSALCYIHEKGIIYADLKPHNILIGPDGHIALTDLGAVVDWKGIISGRQDAEACGTAGPGALFDKSSKQVSPVGTETFVPMTGLITPAVLPTSVPGSFESPDAMMSPTFRSSTVGTPAYMAPEMLLMVMGSETGYCEGYTTAVDCWSLGVTLYKVRIPSRSL